MTALGFGTCRVHGATRCTICYLMYVSDYITLALPEVRRCEADRKGGGVCHRRLRLDGTCPGVVDHDPVHRSAIAAETLAPATGSGSRTR